MKRLLLNKPDTKPLSQLRRGEWDVGQVPGSRFSGCPNGPIWLPSYHTQRKAAARERVLAATFGSSEVPALGTIPPTLTQAADCYRALLLSPWD